jgi:hypothetical protein
LNVNAPTEDKTDDVKDNFCKGIGTKLVVNFATSKNFTVKSMMFPHHNIHKYTWTSPDGKTHNQIDHILIDMGRHSIALDVQSFRAADCDTDQYLMMANLGRD